MTQLVLDPVMTDPAATRPARLADMFMLASLAAQAGCRLNPEEIRHRLLTPGTGTYLVATIADTPVAVAQVHLVPPGQRRGVRWARLSALVVDENHRGIGLGSMLLAVCEDYARFRGAQALEIGLPPSRRPSGSFWRHHDYHPLPPALYAKSLTGNH
ncbi:GNAT family N-acetyltransferase [Kocuria rosea]|uniref:GNAT family N-acetyltransferase n=1 Tax=Kocuria rosea TaxID=1275 RepID=UPI0025B74E75|nr:GNAT family N-acetyltransferase [Kocuria rosea]WJZ68371.1 GNAT family N-acetyltransferase [Kocuria rosea]